MIFIGVTGGIGSGKSTVCSLFKEKQIPVFFADDTAKELASGILLKSIVAEFGNGILDADKNLDRKKLADLVFSDHASLEKLNQLIHPEVFKKFESWKLYLSSASNYAIAEAALFFESGMDTMVDYTLAVIADEKIRTQRVMQRDTVSESRVAARMQRQMSNQELVEYSDFQIYNDAAIGELTSKVNFFHILFSNLSNRKEIE